MHNTFSDNRVLVKENTSLKHILKLFTKNESFGIFCNESFVSWELFFIFETRIRHIDFEVMFTRKYVYYTCMYWYSFAKVTRKKISLYKKIVHFSRFLTCMHWEESYLYGSLYCKILRIRNSNFDCSVSCEVKLNSSTRKIQVHLPQD